MKIIRCENFSGMGPYTDESWDYVFPEWIHTHTRDYFNHPSPYFDFDQDWSGKWVNGLSCGFISIASANEWFTKDQLKILVDNGFHFLVYETTSAEVYIGHHQCVFKKHHAIQQEDVTDVVLHWTQDWPDEEGMEMGSAELP